MVTLDDSVSFLVSSIAFIVSETFFSSEFFVASTVSAFVSALVDCFVASSVGFDVGFSVVSGCFVVSFGASDFSSLAFDVPFIVSGTLMFTSLLAGVSLFSAAGDFIVLGSVPVFSEVVFSVVSVDFFVSLAFVVSSTTVSFFAAIVLSPSASTRF